MTETQTSNVKLHSEVKSGIRIVEPATILTITIGAVYYLGWSYIDAFLRRVGINHLSLELPTSYYVMHGYLTVSALWGVLNFMYLYDADAPRDTSQILMLNTVVLLIGFLLFAPGLFTSPVNFYISIFAVCVTALIVVASTWWGASIIHFMMPRTLIARIFIAVFVFNLLRMNAMDSGELKGKRAVEGKSADTSGITFVWKEKPPSDIEGKQLILILHNNERYFVVEKTDVAPERPRVYVVPDDLVQYAVTTAMGY